MRFEAFSKIPRLNRDIIITEKIDGTNGQVLILTEGQLEAALDEGMRGNKPLLTTPDGFHVWAGSRNRWVQPENDNYGFARWVVDNSAMLVRTLGPGRHFGEWWGPSIQRRYGILEKRFSLFNVSKWGWLNDPEAQIARGVTPQLSVVPKLYEGPWFRNDLGLGPVSAPDYALGMLKRDGSRASPGFMLPEGIVIYHTASGHTYKATLEGDASHKGVQS
jgi:hypothetical protein